MCSSDLFCSENPHEKARKNQLCSGSCSGLIHYFIKYMGADINECFLLKFHKKNGSSIVDCSELLQRIQVVHHDDDKAPYVNWKSCGIETFPFSLSTNVILDSF